MIQNFGSAFKSVIASFAPVERSHAPSIQLKKIAEDKNFPVEVSQMIKELIPLVGELGAEEHFLSDYGDENSGKDPWELFKETDAKKAPLELTSPAFLIYAVLTINTI